MCWYYDRNFRCALQRRLRISMLSSAPIPCVWGLHIPSMHLDSTQIIFLDIYNLKLFATWYWFLRNSFALWWREFTKSLIISLLSRAIFAVELVIVGFIIFQCMIIIFELYFPFIIVSYGRSCSLNSQTLAIWSLPALDSNIIKISSS